MPKNTSCPDLSRYQQLASGQLDEGDRDSLLEHLEGCNACAQKLNTVAEPDTLVEMIRKAEAPGGVASEGIIARLVDRLSKLRPGDASAVAEKTEALRVPGASAAVKERGRHAGDET